MANRLAGESSPYLRQHAENPVEWFPWGDEAFATARDADKPILLSVGYSACHWCHVMAHESFEDATTAALMNDLFVNIKVDREERPDVDTIYMQAVQALSGRGGWPMTVFLTPDGTPYFGGTYFPPEPRHGMRDFRTVLAAAAGAYHERRDAVEAAGAQLREFLQPPRPQPGEDLDDAQLHHACHRLLDDIDWGAGGFGMAPKFPHPGAIDFLLQRFAVTADPRLWDAASLCLDSMARGGIFDQVGGGFHRYSVDATWSVPHFEKMLYDNAQLVPVYIHAYQLSGRGRWRDIAVQTLDYLVREMRTPDGGFAASQDADSVDGEGTFFVWTPEQLRAVLGANDGAFAVRVFGVTAAGNFEGATTVLSLPEPLDVVAADLRVDVDAIVARVDGIRARLLEARAPRPVPGRDGKVLTAWNAMAVSAFAEAGAVLGRADYVDVARECADLLLRELCRDGIVHRSWHEGSARITGFLEDVAGLAGALLTLYEACGDSRYYRRAVELAESIPRRFETDGVLHDTAVDAEPLLVRPRTLDDNPVPAGQSVAALTFLRLHGFTGDATWRRRALAIIQPLASGIARSPLAVATLALAQQHALLAPREIAIAGAVGDPTTQAMVGVVWARLDPARVLAFGADAGVPLLAGRPLVDGRPAAYVCENFACDLPVTDAATLAAKLTTPRAVSSVSG